MMLMATTVLMRVASFILLLLLSMTMMMEGAEAALPSIVATYYSQTVTVDATKGYQSQFAIYCSASDILYADAASADGCRARGFGELASVPSASVFSALAALTASPFYVGGVQEEALNAYKWVGGRYDNRTFAKSLSCVPGEYCNIETQYPFSSTRNVLIMAQAYSYKARQLNAVVGDVFSRVRCFACELSLCSTVPASDGCDATGTAGALALTYYYAPGRFPLANAANAPTGTGGCGCKCKVGYSGPTCSARAFSLDSQGKTEVAELCTRFTAMRVQDAGDMCRDFHPEGYLASIPPPGTPTIASKYALSSPYAWIGASDIDRNGNWYWLYDWGTSQSTATPFYKTSTAPQCQNGRFCNWDAGFPDTSDVWASNTFLLKSTEKWQNTNTAPSGHSQGSVFCALCEYPLCYISRDCVVSNTIAVHKTIKEGCFCECKAGYSGVRCERRNAFVSVNNEYISEFTQQCSKDASPMTWAQASANCSAMGSGWSIASVRTQAVHDAIKGMNTQWANVWLGGHTSDSLTWRWTAGPLAGQQFYKGNFEIYYDLCRVQPCLCDMYCPWVVGMDNGDGILADPSNTDSNRHDNITEGVDATVSVDVAAAAAIASASSSLSLPLRRARAAFQAQASFGGGTLPYLFMSASYSLDWVDATPDGDNEIHCYACERVLCNPVSDLGGIVARTKTATGYAPAQCTIAPPTTTPAPTTAAPATAAPTTAAPTTAAPTTAAPTTAAPTTAAPATAAPTTAAPTTAAPTTAAPTTAAPTTAAPTTVAPTTTPAPTTAAPTTAAPTTAAPTTAAPTTAAPTTAAPTTAVPTTAAPTTAAPTTAAPTTAAPTTVAPTTTPAPTTAAPTTAAPTTAAPTTVKPSTAASTAAPTTAASTTAKPSTAAPTTPAPTTTRCVLSADYCEISNTIAVHATIFDGCFCECLPGYSGERCEVRNPFLNISNKYISEFTQRCSKDASPMTWAQASANCSAMGSGWAIASVRTQTVHEALKAMNTQWANVWLGGHTSDSLTWRWTAGPLAGQQFYKGNFDIYYELCRVQPCLCDMYCPWVVGMDNLLAGPTAVADGDVRDSSANAVAHRAAFQAQSNLGGGTLPYLFMSNSWSLDWVDVTADGDSDIYCYACERVLCNPVSDINALVARTKTPTGYAPASCSYSPTAAPTTVAPTTAAPTTAAPTTVKPSTATPTAAPTTAAPTTAALTTAKQSTAAPTAAPTTAAPTTAAPTTAAPTTAAPTTVKPSTVAPTAAAPTTAAPTTVKPSTATPTAAPTTAAPTTAAPTTAAPTTVKPSTAAPTAAPTTAAPTTAAPTTAKPSTATPTAAPTTAAPTTAAPTTAAPTTAAPTTAAPTTAKPSTAAPATAPTTIDTTTVAPAATTEEVSGTSGGNGDQPTTTAYVFRRTTVRLNLGTRRRVEFPLPPGTLRNETEQTELFPDFRPRPDPSMLDLSGCVALPGPSMIACNVTTGPRNGSRTTFVWELPPELLHRRVVLEVDTLEWSANRDDAGGATLGGGAAKGFLFIGAAVMAFVFIGDPTAIEVQAMIVLFLSPCVGPADHDAARIARYLMSPFYDLGPLAVTLLHVFLPLLMAAIHLLVAMRKASKEKIRFHDALPLVRFPSFSFALANLLFPGVAWGTAALVAEQSYPWAVVLGFLFMLATPAAGVAALLLMAKSVYRLNTTQRNVCKWLFKSEGRWGPEEAERGVRFVRGFGGPRAKLLLIPSCALMILTAWLTTAAVGGITADSSLSTCEGRLIAVAVLMVLSAVGVAVVRPYRHTASVILTVLSLLSVTIIAIAMAAQSRRGGGGATLVEADVDSEVPVVGDDGDDIDISVNRAKIAGVILTVIFTALRSLHWALLVWRERKEPPVKAADGKGGHGEEGEGEEGLLYDHQHAIDHNGEIVGGQFFMQMVDLDGSSGGEQQTAAANQHQYQQQQQQQGESSGGGVMLPQHPHREHTQNDSNNENDRQYVGEEEEDDEVGMLMAAAVAAHAQKQQQQSATHTQQPGQGRGRMNTSRGGNVQPQQNYTDFDLPLQSQSQQQPPPHHRGAQRTNAADADDDLLSHILS